MQYSTDPKWQNFKVGDRAERIGVFVTDYMRGRHHYSDPHRHETDDFAAEYEIDFKIVKAVLHESQPRHMLRRISWDRAYSAKVYSSCRGCGRR